MAKTPVTADTLAAYLLEVLRFSESDAITHLTPIISHDQYNAPVASVEPHHKGRCLRLEAINLRVIRVVAWEAGVPSGPDGTRSVKRNYAGGRGRGKAGVDVDGVRGWLGWLRGGEEP